MDVNHWTVCIIEPKRFEAQIISDLLRHAGVEKRKVFSDPEAAMAALQLYKANVIVLSYELGAADAVAWIRAFRRNGALADRKAAVFVTSSAFSRTMAEECRLAGANALIGKPLSGKVLLSTIEKVLRRPRPFVEGDGYVGPCRRAGIVTAGPSKRRRKADLTQQAPAA
jgi:DNA-binding response OmpR family regulator